MVNQTWTMVSAFALPFIFLYLIPFIRYVELRSGPSDREAASQFRYFHFFVVRISDASLIALALDLSELLRIAGSNDAQLGIGSQPSALLLTLILTLFHLLALFFDVFIRAKIEGTQEVNRGFLTVKGLAYFYAATAVLFTNALTMKVIIGVA